MLNKLGNTAAAFNLTSRAASLAIAISGLWAAGSVLFPGWTTTGPVRADESKDAAADPRKRNALTAHDEKALAEFQKVYRLEMSQNIKYIKPPFLSRSAKVF